jgi:hypothetical protein
LADRDWSGYEGNTLVIDTVSLNTKTFVDSYRTPHSEKLHVVERWHLIDGGNMLEVNITVDDPDTLLSSLANLPALLARAAAADRGNLPGGQFHPLRLRYPSRRNPGFLSSKNRTSALLASDRRERRSQQRQGRHRNEHSRRPARQPWAITGLMRRGKKHPTLGDPAGAARRGRALGGSTDASPSARRPAVPL